MKYKAVAFTGPSNSGKTTLIVKVADELIKNNKVSIVKNDPKNKAVFDTEGKDSWKFSNTGADVVVTSAQKTAYFSKEPKDLEQIIDMFREFDYLLVEGLKDIPLPRIAIFRNKLDESYFPYIDAVAVDDTVLIKEGDIPSNIDILNLNDIEQVILWIEKNSKKVR